ncbi:MAG: hypothetical protein HUN04_06035 [Desulfobacter sp.]|nr:MAG: hypothetical protein HUN04_06035 [Desulfobacter sp.]
MTWNYRIIKRHHAESGTTTLGIHEVYYNEEGAIDSWTQGPMDPHGETLAELKADLEHFAEALEKPVLVEKVKDGKDILVPAADLKNLLDQCEGKDMSLTDEDKSWVNDKTVGREKEGWGNFFEQGPCPDFPSIKELRAGIGEDAPRESLDDREQK